MVGIALVVDIPTRCGAGRVWAAAEVAPQSDPHDRAAVARVLVISDVRFVREGLALVLSEDRGFAVLGLAADRQECEHLVRNESAPEIVLLDAGLPAARELARFLYGCLAGVQVVVFSMHETEEEVIGWAEAGVSAYLPRSTRLADVVHLLHRIRRGEQPCASHVAGGLLRRIAAGNLRPPAPDAALTLRERQVAQFVVVGLSNKEIARQLQVGVPTVKSHVHNMLGKLKLSRRSQLAFRLHEVNRVHAPGRPSSPS